MFPCYFINKNNISLTSTSKQLTSTVFLNEKPKGIYTTAKIKDSKFIIDWNLHLNRLIKSCEIFSSSNPNLFLASQSLKLNGNFKQILNDAILTATKNAFEIVKKDYLNEVNSKDLALIILITDSLIKEIEYKWEYPFDIYVYFREIANYTDTTEVLVTGEPRENAEVKHTQWVTDRMKYLKFITNEIDEIILFKNGKTYEGLLNNFYVIKDVNNEYELWTCAVEDGVLGGTYRKRVIESVKNIPNLKLIEYAPEINDINDWTEAFITNAIQGIRYIKRIIIPDYNIDKNDLRCPGTITKQIKDAVSNMQSYDELNCNHLN